MASTIFIRLAFLLVLSDALLNYFLLTYFRPLPVLALVPVFLFLHILFGNWELSQLRSKHIVLLVLGFLGYNIALLTMAQEVPSFRFIEIAGALAAWLTGYLWFLAPSTAGKDRWLEVLFLTCLHCVICVLALLRVAPGLFPTYDAVWAYAGELISRPSVTTDQNFQVFYFLPAAALYVFARDLRIKLIALFALMLSAYVLSVLQTRSGILVLVGTLIIAILSQLLQRQGAKSRMMFDVVVLSASVIILLYRFADDFGPLLLRFTEVGFETGYGRIHGFVYFLEKIANPLWWVPQGYSEYRSLTGGSIPHSNITAHLLDGGILGVVTWFGLIAVPTVISATRSIFSDLDIDYRIASFVALGMLVAQMSLNVPFVDQTWLWGGVACAVMENLRRNRGRETRRRNIAANEAAATVLRT